jgi:sugar lactone lactonase YvrE
VDEALDRWPPESAEPESIHKAGYALQSVCRRQETGNNQVLKAPPGGTPAGIIGALRPAALAVDQDGTLYVAESSRISKWSATGAFTPIADGLNVPPGLALTADGTVLFAETGSNRIAAVTATNTLITIAGTGMSGFSGDGGPSSSAQLSSPMGLAVDVITGFGH